MTLPDYPPGEWSAVLVGPQWVSGTTLTIITNALANRRAIVTHFSDLHDTLQSALNTTLPKQKGITADAMRDAFRQGADQAFHVAEKNEAYAKVLQRAHNDVIVLRHLLTDIAERGNKEIKDALNSKADFATKVAKISEVIADRQREANTRAAGCAEDIMDAGGEVFAAQGNGQSFRGLAHANGLDNVNRQPDLSAIEDEVRTKLNQPAGLTPPGATPGTAPAASPPGTALGAGTNIPKTAASQLPGTGMPAAAPAPGTALGAGTNIAKTAAPQLPGASAPSVPAAPSIPAAPSAPATGMPAGLTSANPTNVAPPGLNTGAPGSAPAPAAGSGLPAGPVQAMEPQVPPTPPAAPTFPSAATGAPVFETPPAVEQPPAPPTPAQSPPGIGAQGVMAAAGGALAGAVSADATARARLQRLVESVARQQPRLAWAVGDCPDGTTILVTDLASGWIPPGVDIPAAVTLLEPARRRGDLETLLGEVSAAAAYTPEHYLPDPDADEPVPTSLRPRRAPDIEELSWELSHATHWRDGLPRLAHTLAKAASRGTGVLESEAEQLHDELTKLADRVLDSYPDTVDAAEVGNWQLLAAIDALVTRDKTAANYHLAWFLACNTAVAEGVMR